MIFKLIFFKFKTVKVSMYCFKNKFYLVKYAVKFVLTRI